MSKPLAIIQMGEPPAAVLNLVGQQSDWFIDSLSLAHVQHRIYRPDLDEPLPLPTTLSGAIISGAWEMMTDLNPWSEVIVKWIRSAHKSCLPLFGVCYGHQLIAHALGGEVGVNPGGCEQGLQLIELCGDYQNEPLLKHLPQRISAWLSHQQTVLRPPVDAKVMGFSAQDACQIIKYSDTTFSVQFHPEFSLSIMLEYLKYNEAIYLLPDSNLLPVWPKIILQRFYQYLCAEPEYPLTH